MPVSSSSNCPSGYCIGRITRLDSLPITCCKQFVIHLTFLLNSIEYSVMALTHFRCYGGRACLIQYSKVSLLAMSETGVIEFYQFKIPTYCACSTRSNRNGKSE